MRLLNLTHPIGTLARSSALLASLVAALTLTACGGGGGGGGSVGGSGGTGATTSSFSQGVITGFGSIIVNGIRHDDSSASVTDDDDDDNPARSKDDLKLGMVVSVSGTSGTGTGTGTASAIAFGSELKGPVQSINGSTATGTATLSAGTQTLVILGQTVIVGTRTVFDLVSLPDGFASIKKGDVLEVHGLLDPAANKLTATRIERENNANRYKITGNVKSLNTGSKSFKIGSETISFANIDPNRLRVTLANDITVRVALSTNQKTTGTWDAIRIKAAKKNMEDRNKVEIEGLITDFVSTSKFSVSGIPVDASNASFPKGTSTLANGVRVEVEGSIVSGTLIAKSVKPENDNDDEDRGNELHGFISSVNAGSKTFELRGLTVSYAGNVIYQRGTVSDLVKGANVEVKGVASANGTTIVAQKIKFED
jgi:Domain of unknown function (DUF5666)